MSSPSSHPWGFGKKSKGRCSKGAQSEELVSLPSISSLQRAPISHELCFWRNTNVMVDLTSDAPNIFGRMFLFS